MCPDQQLHHSLTSGPPSPKSRIQPVYSVPLEPSRRKEASVYQLEDSGGGHARLRLRVSVRSIAETEREAFIYRVEAFSRLTGERLGVVEVEAEPGSPEEFAVASRQFQSAPFRAVVDRLSAEAVDRFAGQEQLGPVQR